MKLKVLNLPFPYLDNFRNRLIHVLIVLLFSVGFMEVFKPFNINVWMKFQGWMSWVGLSGFAVLGTVIIAISQLLVRPRVRIKVFEVRHFALWFVAELICVTVLLTLFYGDPHSSFLSEVQPVFRYTSLVLVVPYSFSILIITLVWYRKQNASKQGDTIHLPDLISFKDERDHLKFGVNRTDILYLESTDNYITVYYLNEGLICKEMVRTSLKKIEKAGVSGGIVRCHRSFMVNMENVLWMKKEGRNFFLKIKSVDTLIPVSQSYIPGFKSLMQA